MADYSSVSISSLLCDEEFAGSDDEQTDAQQGLCNADEDDDEYVKLLLKREIDFPRFTGFGELTTQLMNNKTVLDSRMNAINWILQAGSSLDFRVQTTYLSVTYFDRILSKRLFKKEEASNVQLVSLLCLSLAAKIEENSGRPLSKYPMPEDHSGASVQRTEITVLRLLQWRLRSVTPFCYIHYFLSKFANQSSRRILTETVSEHLVAIITDINLMSHRPSAIAAAATLFAVDDSLSRDDVESKINVLSLNHFPPIEDVIFCYDKLKERINPSARSIGNKKRKKVRFVDDN